MSDDGIRLEDWEPIDEAERPDPHYVYHPLVTKMANEWGMQEKWVEALVHDAVYTYCELLSSVAMVLDHKTTPEDTELAVNELIEYYVRTFDNWGKLDENMPGPGHRLDPDKDMYEDS